MAGGLAACLLIFIFKQNALILCSIPRVLKPSIQIDHPKYESAGQSGLNCCILIGRTFVSYAILDAASSIVYRIRHYAFSDKLIGKNDFNTILSDPIFQQTAKLKIAIDSLKSTLVPGQLFDADQAETYFTFVHELPAGEALYTQSIPGGIKALFSLKKPTVSFLGNWRKDIQLMNASTCLLSAYPLLLGNEQQSAAFIWSREENITLTVYRDGKLYEQQEYTEIDAMDLCYHLGHLCAANAIGQQHLAVFLHGEGEKPDYYFRALEKYFPKVQYCRRPATLQYPDAISSQPSHYFLTLLSMAQCEL